MNSLGLTTIGKKSKFVMALQTLFGKYFWEKKIIYFHVSSVDEAPSAQIILLVI